MVPPESPRRPLSAEDGAGPDAGLGAAAGSSDAPPSRIDAQQAFAELGRIPLWETPLPDVLHRVAELAKASIPGADEVSITLIDGDKPSTVAFTGDLAVQLDERQYEDGFGPCMDAARTGGTLALLDLEVEERYTGFVGAARRAGVTGTLSVGMPVPGRVVGGLNIYRLGDGRGGAGQLDQDSVQVAELFAGYAAVALANAELLQSTQRLAQQMREAMTSRATIEQAKGVLVAREGCTPEEAFGLLVGESRRRNRKLALVAADLIAEAQARSGRSVEH